MSAGDGDKAAAARKQEAENRVVFMANYYLNIGLSYDDTAARTGLSWGQIQHARTEWIDMFPSADLRARLRLLPLFLGAEFRRFAKRSQSVDLATRSFHKFLEATRRESGRELLTKHEITSLDLENASKDFSLDSEAELIVGLALIMNQPVGEVSRDRAVFWLGKVIRETHRSYNSAYFDHLRQYIRWVDEVQPYGIVEL